MKSQLRKAIHLPIYLDGKTEEVLINIDWDILDKIEQVYNSSADYVVSQVLANIYHVQRRHVAQLLCLWCQGKTNLKQVEIAEAVKTASQSQFYRYIGMIQAAALWCIRGEDGKPMITDAQFDALVEGRDLDEDEKPAEKKEPKAGDTKPKKPRKAT